MSQLNQKEYIFKAQIIDEQTENVIAEVSSFSPIGLDEEMGKKKWTEAIKNYEAGLEEEMRLLREDEEINEKEYERQEQDSHTHPI